VGSEFRIQRSVLDAIVDHARAASPAECCGMLIGRGNTIDEAMRAANLADKPTRFVIDPRDHIAARRSARSRGLEVLGFYHSHPHSAAWPSRSDVAEATYPEAVHLIVSLQGGLTSVGLFGIARGSATELILTSI